MTVPRVRFTGAGQRAAVGPERPYTCVYDGACPVCVRFVEALQKWDCHHEIEVVSSQTAGVPSRFPWIPARAYADALQVIGPSGRTWQGAAAIEQLLNVLPRGKLVAWLFKLPFAQPIAERVYRWVARNRYRLGCGAHCHSRPFDVEFEQLGTDR